MLNKISSSYILKQILDNINNKRKLNIIKYNKKLQNRADFNILDYKRFSGKYIIENKYGEIVEYNGGNNHRIYEGEYLDGKRNGQGREYNSDGKLIFEGEYSEGKKFKGYIYEYADTGNLIFEGGYLCGKNGKGKEYDKFNKEL